MVLALGGLNLLGFVIIDYLSTPNSKFPKSVMGVAHAFKEVKTCTYQPDPKIPTEPKNNAHRYSNNIISGKVVPTCQFYKIK
jgi:hypothetical protein